MIYDLIIVGAGVSGIFAGINSPKDRKVLILEKTDSTLNKLLISGKGACNFTHCGSEKEFLENFDKSGAIFLRPAIYYLSNRDSVDFFENRGLECIENSYGKFFPKSMRASDVKKTLMASLPSGVKIKYNSQVNSIEKHIKSGEQENPIEEKVNFREQANSTEKQEFFSIKFVNLKTKKEEELVSRKVLLCTGGKSVPKTGSCGDGYFIAKKLKHTIIEPKPALASIRCNLKSLSKLVGVSFQDVSFALFRDNRKMADFSGDILITHKGLSGPAIIDNSHNFNKGDILKINFINKNSEEVLNILMNNKKIECPKRLLSTLKDDLSISDTKNCSKKLLRKLAILLTEYEISISEIEGFKTCMATAGGVSLKEVNSKTLESKIVAGLFFSGEVLDYTAKTGGYNIQAAFSTAKLAIDNIFISK